MNLIQLCLLFIFALASSILLTFILIKKLPGFGLVDRPSSRRVHTRTTPRGGGAAIVGSFIVSFIAYEYFVTGSLASSVKLIPIFALIAFVSFLDDLKTLAVTTRLAIHLLCAGLAVYLFLSPSPLFHNELPSRIDFLLATIGLTAFLNIYNFLDGIDGITASESIHLSFTILILTYLKFDIIPGAEVIIIIATIILGSATGFLIFNWHPARIFSGDVGSISLGFLLGLCLLLISAASERLFASAAIASLYYTADGGLTILIRLVNREKIWEPHLKHFFQKAVRKGYSHQQVARRVIACNFLLMLLAVYALYSPAISIILALLVVMITLIHFAK